MNLNYRKLLLLANVVLGLLALSAKAATTAPSITTQPASVTAAVSTTPSMTVSAGGTTPLKYQWYSGGAALANATNASLSFPNVQSSQAAGYQVVITNSAGAVTSVVATLSVYQAVAITQQPVGQTVLAGSTVTLSASATGNPAPTYQWLLGTANLTGATGATLTLANAQPGQSGTYSVKVANAYSTVTSVGAAVNIGVPPGIVTQPTNVTFYLGTTATLTVVASGTGVFTYQWYCNNVAVTGQSGATLSLGNVAYSAAGDYRVVVSSPYGTVTSDIATLTIVGPPVLVSKPASITNAVAGSTLTLAAVAAGNPAPLWKWYLQGLEIAGATNASLTFTNAQATDGGHFQVVAYNPNGQAQAECDLSLNLTQLPFADAFASRGTIAGNSGLGAGNNVSATKEPYEPSHFTSKHDRSVWVQWTAPQTGVATFSTDGSSFDTVLAVYTGSVLTNLVRIVNDDNSGGYGNSEVKFNATAGTSYSVVVAGIGNGSAGCKGGIVLKWGLLVTASQLSYVTQQPLPTSLPLGGTLALATTLSTNFLSPPQVQWYFENDPIVGATSTNLVINNCQAGSVGLYRAYIYWDNLGYGLGYFSQGADVQINTEGLVNVLAQNRQLDADLSPLTGVGAPISSPLRARLGTAVAGYSGSQIFATRLGKDPSEPDHCGVVGGSSYWLSYKAPTNGVLMLNTEGSTYDTLLAVYTDDGLGNGYASLHSVACDNNSGANGLTSKLQFNCTNAVTYYIVVDGVNGAYGTAYLNYKLGRRPTISTVAAQTGTEDTLKTLTVTITDPDTALSSLVMIGYSSNTNIVPVTNITFSGTTGSRTVNIRGATNANGAVTISLVVKDTDGLTATNSFTFTMAAVNDLPVAGTDTLTRPVNVSAKILISTVLANDTDVEGPVTFYAVATTSYLGAAITKDATYIYYTAIANKNTADYFTYTIKDSAGATATGRVNVTTY